MKTLLISLLSLFVITVTALDLRAQRPGGISSEQFDQMTFDVAKAYREETADKATELAVNLLAVAPDFSKHWNYGNAIHIANTVLGLVALDRDDLKEAKTRLLESGKTPGSPQLKSFGPNMKLADRLLKKGESAAVLTYLDEYRIFWKQDSDDKLTVWKKAIAKGEPVDFGANLRYFF
ncbi:MAG: hypothetical protein ABJB40_02745 [Acidobacteriota bacterium]